MRKKTSPYIAKIITETARKKNGLLFIEGENIDSTNFVRGLRYSENGERLNFTNTISTLYMIAYRRKSFVGWNFSFKALPRIKAVKSEREAPTPIYDMSPGDTLNGRNILSTCGNKKTAERQKKK